jgi:hypothetical protein
LHDKFEVKFDQLLVTEDGKKKGELAWVTLLNPKEYAEWLVHIGWDDRSPIIKALKEDLKEQVFQMAKIAEQMKKVNAQKQKQINTFIEVNDDFKEEANRPITLERKTLGRKLMAMYSPDQAQIASRCKKQHKALTGRGANKEKDPWAQLWSTIDKDCSAFFGDLLLDIQFYGDFAKFDLLMYWCQK